MSCSIMASSLQPQLQMLLSSSDYCGNLSTSYLRSILDCAYAFGGTTGLFWGYLADRLGRRRVTLLGLWSMFICCLSGGFVTSLAGCAIVRFFAGMVSSTIVCTSLTMIGDLSITAEDRTRNVAKLPLISLCGSLGPLMQGMVSESLRAYGMVWEKFPTLGSELACGSVLFAIALTASVLLKETLPQHSSKDTNMDCEKAAFLTRDSSDTSITLVNDNTARPEPIKIAQFLQAPSFIVLLSSFCLLSLHAATFDVLLPHLGHSDSQHGGMGIPCAWLSFVVLIVRGIAGLIIVFAIPYANQKLGLVKLYRLVSMLFPAIYVITPLLAVLASSCAAFVPVVSVFSILVKHTMTNGALVLVALLVLNTTPDAFSAGTAVGMMQVASLFKAFAVAVSGTSYYFSDDVSIQTTNLALWSCLAMFGLAGAALAWFVRERPSVEMDWPSEVLCWEMCFDADKEKGKWEEEDLESLLGDD
jgi:MFS family permease